MQNLNSIVSDLAYFKTNEAVILQVLEEISVQYLKDKAMVVSKVKLIDQSNDVVRVVRVLLHEKIEKLALAIREFVIYICVPRDFYRYLLLGLVIETSNNLCKRTLAKNFKYLVPVHQMVPKQNIIIAFLIVQLLLDFFLCSWILCPFNVAGRPV